MSMVTMFRSNAYHLQLTRHVYFQGQNGASGISLLPYFLIFLSRSFMVRDPLMTCSTHFRMLMTKRTACTATSYSLSSVMATMRSLNLLVKSSNLPFSSSLAYSGCKACYHKNTNRAFNKHR